MVFEISIQKAICILRDFTHDYTVWGGRLFMGNGCRITLSENTEHCNHILGVDLEIWFMVCSFLIVVIILFFRIVYGAIRGDKLSDMIEVLVEPMDSDDGELKIGNVAGILGTLAKDDDDD